MGQKKESHVAGLSEVRIGMKEDSLGIVNALQELSGLDEGFSLHGPVNGPGDIW